VAGSQVAADEFGAADLEAGAHPEAHLVVLVGHAQADRQVPEHELRLFFGEAPCGFGHRCSFGGREWWR